MKKLVIVILLILPLVLCGCNTNLANADVTRDQMQIGGALSFSYDKSSAIITMGGENEVVQYYQENLEQGFTEEGPRVGLKFTAPNEIDGYEGIKIWVDNQENPPYVKQKQVNGVFTREIEIFPLITDVNKKIEIKIIWKSGTKEQTYLLNFAKGTSLMKKQIT